MTWIVGQSTIFGYAAAISDVRVTLTDKSEHDCLQKVYSVGRFMAMGFSGSVSIGFKMVARLAELLHTDDPELAWQPDVVARWWPDDAAEIFQDSDEEERDLGCSLILLSALPNENAGDVPWPRCLVHCFHAPNFEPELAGPNEVVSIGSGSEPYASALAGIANDLTDLQMEVGNPGGAAFGLMMAVRATFEQSPVPGISRHLQICLVRRGQIEIHHFNRKSLGGTGGDLLMPPLATSPDELARILGFGSATAKRARC